MIVQPRSRKLLLPGVGLLAASDAWAPTDISNLVAWYDASDATTMFTDAGSTQVSNDADTVAQFNDKSGNDYHLSGGGGTSPDYKVSIQNSLSVLRIDGSGDFMTRTTTPDLNQPYTYVMAIIPSLADNDVVIDSESAAGAGKVWRDGSNTTYSMNSGSDMTGPTIGSTAEILVCIFNGASSSFYLDGGTADTGNPGTTEGTGLSLGAEGGSAAKFAYMDVCEIIITSDAMSVADINNAGEYLADKWGTTWSTAS